MIIPAVLMMFTSCSQEEEVTADIGINVTTRKPITLTLYAITGESTTPEAVEAVEKKLNQLTEVEYSTTLDLRLYTADEYEQALENAYISLQHDKEIAAFCDSAAKIGNKMYKKINKILTEEEQNAKTLAEKKEAKEKAKAEAELAAKIEAGEIETEPVELNQVDILFIEDFEYYMKNVNELKLAELDEYLKLDSRILTDYIHPTLLSAAKYNGYTYGLPINKGIETETTYYVLDKELVEKYQFDTSSLKMFANIESFLAAVKAGEPNVIPLLKAPEEIQGYDFYDNIIGHPIGITNPEFAKYTPVNSRRTYSEMAVTNFFDLMSSFRKQGFLPDYNANTEGLRFAVDIRKGTDIDVKEWESQGYIVEVYKTARATTENAIGSMYAVSTYSKYPARCMEILEMLYTNPEFKNIFTFGVEGTNFYVNGDNTITRINDNYMMDFMKTGNTFIGYLDAGMDPDYVEKAVVKNFDVKRHGFLAFQVELTEEEQKALDWYVEQIGDTYESLRQGIPNAAATYTRIASKLDRGNADEGIPGLKDFLFTTDEVTSSWDQQFQAYKVTVPPTVSVQKEELYNYMNRIQN